MTIITREQGLAVIALVWFAGLLLYFMLSGFTQPFNGVAMRGQVMSIEQISEFSGVDATGFLLPVFCSIPEDWRLNSRTIKPAFYIEPGDEVWVTGVIYNYYQILRANDHYWVDGRFITMDPTQFEKGE